MIDMSKIIASLCDGDEMARRRRSGNARLSEIATIDELIEWYVAFVRYECATAIGAYGE